MADDTGLPHEIPFLEAADLPSIHGITAAMAAQIAERLGAAGTCIVATEESGSGSLAVLTTPDIVTDLDVPAGGTIEVEFVADVKESVANQAYMAVIVRDSSAGLYAFATATNMQSSGGPSATNYGAARTAQWPEQPLVYTATTVSTNEAVPVGRYLVRVRDTDTYSVEIAYGTSSGTVTAKNRKLTVRVRP